MENFPEVLEHLRTAKNISKKELAARAGLTPGYVSHLIRGARTRPSRDTVEALASALNATNETKMRLLQVAGYEQGKRSPAHDGNSETSIGHDGLETDGARPISVTRRSNLEDSPETAAFYGRQQELATLEQWIVIEHSQIVVVSGLGGIGKTAFSVKLAHLVEPSFAGVYWRSLQDVPPVETFLEDCISFYSDQDLTDIPQDEDRFPLLLDLLIEIFRKSRCLLIMDNFESVLREGESTGEYRERYEGYGRLLRRIGEARHQSCLLLTTREKPREIVRMENDAAPVKSFILAGISHVELQEILRDRGIHGSPTDWEHLTSRYSGNPLALKLAAGQIHELFQGDIEEFLKQESIVFSDIFDLLEQQFKRLSRFEMGVMYWLAINLEPTSSNDLYSDLVGPLLRSTLLDALDSLKRRSMIETAAPGYFRLQPAILEYIVKVFVEKVCQELETKQFQLFESHALIKAQAKDYLRERQTRLLLDPVAKFIVSRCGQAGSEAYLRDIIRQLQQQSVQTPGYMAGNIINLLVHLRVNLHGYDFSQLTIWQAFLQGYSLTHVNFSGSDLSKSVFTETFGNIYTVALSADGKRMAAGTANGEIRIWENYGTVPTRTLEGHTDYVRSVAFSPDGEVLASASQDKTVRLWNVTTGQCIKKLEGHSDWVWGVTFSPDGQRLASSGDDRAIRVWDVQTGECLQVLQAHTRWVRAVCFSHDGRLLASGSDDRTIRLWDLDAAQSRVIQGHGDRIRGLAFSPDSSTLASSSDDRTIRLWDVKSEECLHVLHGHANRVRSIAFSHDGAMLASGSDDQTIRVWSVQTGECLKILYGHGSWVRSVIFSHDDKTLVSGSEDQTIRHWDASTGQCLKVMQGHRNELYSLMFGPTGKLLISGGEDQTVRLWNVADGRCTKAMVGHTGRVRAVAVSPDGSLAVSASEDQTLRVWDIESGLCLQTLQDQMEYGGRVWSVTFSPDGTLLASGHEDHGIRLWDVSTGQLLRVLRGHSEWVWSLSFSPDGQTLASSGDEETIRVWNVPTGECLSILNEHTHRVRAVAFSPDGQLLASGSDDQTVRLWGVSSGRCLQVLEGHQNRVRSVAFSPTAPLLASSGENEAICLWNIETGERVKRFGERNSVRVVSFSPEGQLLASDSYDSMIKLWGIPSGKYIQMLRSDRPYERMNINGAKGLSEAQRGMLRSLGAIGIPSS